MAVRIRLQRRGTHKRPFYHIVVADRRAPRDHVAPFDGIRAAAHVRLYLADQVLDRLRVAYDLLLFADQRRLGSLVDRRGLRDPVGPFDGISTAAHVLLHFADHVLDRLRVAPVLGLLADRAPDRSCVPVPLLVLFPADG